MQIDARKQWMYGDPHLKSEFIAGLHKFIDVAEANKVDNFMPCPCLDCRNVKEYSNSTTIQGHVLRRGFMPKYYCWTLHGERGVMMEDNEEEEDADDNYHMFTEENGDTAMEDNEEEGGEGEPASDEPADGLGRVISDAKRECDTDKEKLKLEAMLQDHKKLLYPTCEDSTNTKLGTTLELMQWKAENGVRDKGFDKLMTILKRKFPKDNELPETTYEAKKAICPLGLEVQKIHACPNDCILYRGIGRASCRERVCPYV